MKYKAVKPPEWFAKGSIYQINPRTFSREGTLRAIIEALPELAELGFKVVYLCPIFESKNSKSYPTSCLLDPLFPAHPVH